ncbi:MAG: hypothetical protein JWO92_2488 [Chitinophagaceae bacterium]|nr:hypothetical protein [Chitinophagaceae bacterium]
MQRYKIAMSEYNPLKNYPGIQIVNALFKFILRKLFSFLRLIVHRPKTVNKSR